MSLFGSIQMAANTLRAQQIGMQVVGQNIANVNTPGYIRAETVFSPAPTQKVGSLLLGLGVQVTAVVQKIDTFLEDRLRAATSDRASSEAENDIWLQLEGLLSELSENDLSTSMNRFFNSISEVLNQPESASVRNLAVLAGETLAGDINRLASRAQKLRSDANDRITGMASDINRLLEEVRVLNIRITQTEGGDISASDAVGLRDQRLLALHRLAELIDVRVEEQPSGATNVFVGGEFLVFEGTARSVEVTKSGDRGLNISTIQISQTKSPLPISSGELAGATTARDDVLGTFLDTLNEFTATLIFEFNRVYASGQGLSGYQELTSQYAATSTSRSLDDAGLPFVPDSGHFQVLVYNKQTGLTRTTDVPVNLNGLDSDLTLDGLAAILNGIDGLSASVSLEGRLTIRSDSPEQDFAFREDTSGVLAALGLNTFFVGSTAGDIRVNSVVRSDPSKFAASQSGIGEDTSNAVLLADFLDRDLASQNGNSLSVMYVRMIGSVTQSSSVAQSVYEGFATYEQTLEGQKLAISGVNLDEEAVRLITYQYAYQASARYISTLSELLSVLVSL